MKIRRTLEYEVMCKGCGSLLKVRFDELHFEGINDQRIPCPACRCPVLVVQGGMVADGVVPKVRDSAWREANNAVADAE